MATFFRTALRTSQLAAAASSAVALGSMGRDQSVCAAGDKDALKRKLKAEIREHVSAPGHFLSPEIMLQSAWRR